MFIKEEVWSDEAPIGDDKLKLTAKQTPIRAVVAGSIATTAADPMPAKCSTDVIVEENVAKLPTALRKKDAERDTCNRSSAPKQRGRSEDPPKRLGTSKKMAEDLEKTEAH